MIKCLQRKTNLGLDSFNNIFVYCECQNYKKWIKNSDKVIDSLKRTSDLRDTYDRSCTENQLTTDIIS